MSNAPLPQVYVDLLGTVPTTAISGQAVVVYNRYPEPNETDVPVNAPIEIWWADTAEVGLTSAVVTVQTSTGSVAAVTIAGSTPTFNAAYTGASNYARQTSLGGSTLNEHKLQLVRNTPWTSQERVIVRVQVTPTSGTPLDALYFFFIEDVTVPRLASARTQGLDTLVVVFSEPLAMHADAFGALRVREISGQITFTEPNIVEIENAGITSDDVGSFVSFTGSERAVNNTYFKIGTVAAGAPTLITTVEPEIAAEAPQLAQRAFVSPYRLVPVMAADSRVPSYTPCISAAAQLDERTVLLTLDQQLSPGRPYQLYASNVADAAEPANVIDSTSVAFTAETVAARVGRSFALWNMIPQMNKADDVSGDLERLIRCVDEVTQLIVSDTDNFENILDIDVAPTDAVDALLFHLGNPYTFLRTEMEKRRALATLVATYQDSGIERAIETAVLEILGITINVFPFNNPDVAWVLGESEMGLTSILGTDDEFLRYSFEIIVFERQDVVMTGSSRTMVKLQTGGLATDQFVGRTLRVGTQDREILSNTADTVVVDQPYSAVPPPLSIATILGVLSDDERSIIQEIANIWRPVHTHFVRFIESGSIVPTY